jgi:GT2 family glycosyltransferase
VRYGGLLAREVIAVTGGCLMMRRADYLAVGGLSTSFPLSFNDVDLCLRVQRAVGRVVIDPTAALVHHETLTREPVITADEWSRWIDRWGEIVDPWYHPAYHRPDDPHDLARNANHLEPGADDPERPPQARRPRLRSRVHRGRPALDGG